MFDVKEWTEQGLQTYLYHSDITVEYMLPLALITSDVVMTSELTDDLMDLAQSSDLVELMNLSPESSGYHYIPGSSSVEELLEVLHECGLDKGVIIKMTGRMYERSGSHSWSGTSCYIHDYAYAKDFSGILNSIAGRADAMITKMFTGLDTDD